jgi:DNA-binding transcriptional ArsR family regulator
MQMRALVHPAVEDVTVEGILHALADPVRVAIFSAVAGADGPLACTNVAAAAQRRVPKSTLSRHFTVLREAGLIRSERRGVEVRNTSRCAEIEGRFPGLIRAIITAHAVQARGKASRGGSGGGSQRSRSRERRGRGAPA